MGVIANKIRSAVYGKDVREDIAQGIEAVESLREEFDIQVISAGDSNSEIAAARIGEVSLPVKIGKIDTLLATRAKKQNKIFYVEDYGAKGDYNPITKVGTDDTYPFRNAVLACESAGGGIVVLDAKNYLITKGIEWKSGVSLIGAGENLSCIYASGVINAVLWQPGVVYNPPNENYSPSNPMRDMVFRDFSINCTEMTNNGKAILLFFLKNVLFQDITIIDSPATALGCDFLDDVTIRRVTTINAGRKMSEVGIGCSGIGIGTGAWEIENILVTECRTIGSGNYGIFFEKQNYGTQTLTTPYYSKGAVIDKCIIENSGVAGIGDNGVDGMIVRDSIIKGNYKGVEIIDYGKNGKIINCEICDNTKEGVHFLATSGDGYYIDDATEIYNNGTHGINIDVDVTPMNDLTIKSKIHNNGANAINIIRDLINPTIVDGKFYNNGTNIGGGTNQHGMVLRANMTNPIISRNNIYDDQEVKTQRYGIYMSDVTINGGFIKDNILVGNSNKSIYINGTTLTGLTIKDNKGYNPIGITTLAVNLNFTYTSGASSEVLYLVGAGIEAKINDVTMITNSTNATIYLEPNVTASVTSTTMTSAKVFKN